MLWCSKEFSSGVSDTKKKKKIFKYFMLKSKTDQKKSKTWAGAILHMPHWKICRWKVALSFDIPIVFGD